MRYYNNPSPEESRSPLGDLSDILSQYQFERDDERRIRKLLMQIAAKMPALPHGQKPISKVLALRAGGCIECGKETTQLFVDNMNGGLLCEPCLVRTLDG